MPRLRRDKEPCLRQAGAPLPKRFGQGPKVRKLAGCAAGLPVAGATGLDNLDIHIGLCEQSWKGSFGPPQRLWTGHGARQSCCWFPENTSFLRVVGHFALAPMLVRSRQEVYVGRGGACSSRHRRGSSRRSPIETAGAPHFAGQASPRPTGKANSAGSWQGVWQDSPWQGPFAPPQRFWTGHGLDRLAIDS